MLVSQGMHRLHVLRASIISARLLPGRQKHLSLNIARVMSTTSGSVQGPQLYVHTPTVQELDAAWEALSQAPLVASKGASPEETQHCTLHFAQAGQPESSRFDVARYYGSLDTAVLGRLVLAADAITSTQTIIQDNVAALPDGTLCIADKQIGGKGRGGNRWESPEGCLMFSVCKRLELPGPRLPFVQYLVSLAAVQAIQASAQQQLQGGAVDVRIKWPNDLYSGALKLGGVLCHSSYRGGMYYVIMGVGLNLANRQPTTCVDALIENEAQRLGLPAPVPVTREALLAGVMTRLEGMLTLLCQQGFQPFEQDYYQAWLHSDQEVQLEEEGQRVRVRVRGLSHQGYLEAVDSQGERYELHPDGNSFDFFKGLVRKKIS